MLHTDIKAYRRGDDVVLEVTNRKMLRSDIIYGQERKGTIAIGNNLGEQEDPLSTYLYHYVRCLHRCPGATCYNVFYVMSKRKA